MRVNWTWELGIVLIMARKQIIRHRCVSYPVGTKMSNFLQPHKNCLYVYLPKNEAHKEEMLQRSDAPRRKDWLPDRACLWRHRETDAEPRKFETAPTPENYPDSGSGAKCFSGLRLRFRLGLRVKCTGFGGSGSGIAKSSKFVTAPGP